MIIIDNFSISLADRVSLWLVGTTHTSPYEMVIMDTFNQSQERTIQSALSRTELL